jgi:phosphoribosylamine--glycine ligase
VKVLVVGAGAREHALAWRLAASRSVSSVLVAPGNPGVADVAEPVPIEASDVDGLIAVADGRGVDLTVVGPELPLVGGLADAFATRGLPVFGPSAAGARLEGSKAFAKRLCEEHGIPAARSRSCSDVASAFEALERLPGPYVVKADGLAAGKGVTVTDSLAEARRAIEACLVDAVFGAAGGTVVIEEHLDGAEVSALALTDGERIEPLTLAQDFKRALDGDRGPNTGGMGAFSPLPFVDEANREAIESRILRATVAALRAEGIDYRGVIYAGLMLTAEGPKVLEFNCRFGDPETQVILPRLASDLGSALLACAEGGLGGEHAVWRQEACVGVVLASRGYPGTYETGLPIEGSAEAARVDGALVFHAGTSRRGGRVVTSGGRVFTVSALGRDLEVARARAYEAAALISFDGVRYRRDIAAAAAEATAAAGGGGASGWC